MSRIVKSSWTMAEDAKLAELTQALGVKQWSLISQSLPGRTGKQCRERWFNQLDPSINKSPWTLEEEKVLLQAHEELGNQWTEIAKRLPGRTDNNVKNHWNGAMRRRYALDEKGDLVRVDPRAHSEAPTGAGAVKGGGGGGSGDSTSPASALTAGLGGAPVERKKRGWPLGKKRKPASQQDGGKKAKKGGRRAALPAAHAVAAGAWPHVFPLQMDAGTSTAIQFGGLAFMAPPLPTEQHMVAPQQLQLQLQLQQQHGAAAHPLASYPHPHSPMYDHRAAPAAPSPLHHHGHGHGGYHPAPAAAFQPHHHHHMAPPPPPPPPPAFAEGAGALEHDALAGLVNLGSNHQADYRPPCPPHAGLGLGVGMGVGGYGLQQPFHLHHHHQQQQQQQQHHQGPAAPFAYGGVGGADYPSSLARVL